MEATHLISLFDPVGQSYVNLCISACHEYQDSYNASLNDNYYYLEGCYEIDDRNGCWRDVSGWFIRGIRCRRS